MAWDQVDINRSNEGSVFGCRIKTGAQTTRLMGPYGDRVKLAVDEPARKGKANERIRTFLADLFECQSSDVSILSGTTGPDKKIQVRNRTPGQIRALLKKRDQGKN